MKPEKKLSIVICGIPGRSKKLKRLLSVLVPQITEQSELIIMIDTRPQTAKLTDIMRTVNGEYMTIVDDDDMVASDFVSSILDKTNLGNDMIGYDITYDDMMLTESSDNHNPYRFIHHTYRTDILKPFPVAEDIWDPPYVYSLDIKKWSWIDRPLYFYNYDPEDSVQNGTAK